MSEQDESGERTELPTEKRLREAREQGNIPRSRELATAAVFGAVSTPANTSRGGAPGSGLISLSVASSPPWSCKVGV